MIKKLSLLISLSIFLTACSYSTSIERPADIYYMQADYQASINSYLEELKEEPESIEAYLGLARNYNQLEEYDKSIEVLEEGLGIVGKNRELYSQAYRTYMDMGKNQEALDLILKLRQDSQLKNSEQLVDLAEIYRRMDRKQELVELIDKYKRTVKFQDQDYLDMIAYLEAREDAEAIEDFSMEVIIESRSFPVINQVFKSYDKLDYEEGIYRLIDRLELRSESDDDRSYLWYEYWNKELRPGEQTIDLLPALEYESQGSFLSKSRSNNNLIISRSSQDEYTVYLQEGLSGDIIDRKKLDGDYIDAKVYEQRNFIVNGKSIVIEAHRQEGFKDYYLITDHSQGRLDSSLLEFKDDLEISQLSGGKILIESKQLGYKKIIGSGTLEGPISKNNRIDFENKSYIESIKLGLKDGSIHIEKKYRLDPYGYYQLEKLEIRD